MTPLRRFAATSFVATTAFLGFALTASTTQRAMLVTLAVYASLLTITATAVYALLLTPRYGPLFSSLASALALFVLAVVASIASPNCPLTTEPGRCTPQQALGAAFPFLLVIPLFTATAALGGMTWRMLRAAYAASRRRKKKR